MRIFTLFLAGREVRAPSSALQPLFDVLREMVEEEGMGQPCYFLGIL